MGLCKSRQTETKGVKQIQSKVQCDKEDTSARASAKAWARLHGEAPLNPDADPFVPQSQPRDAAEAARARPRTRGYPPHLPSTGGGGECNGLSAKQMRTRRADPVRPPRNPQPQPQVQIQPDEKLDASFAASFALRTCEYKKLLQDPPGGNLHKKLAQDGGTLGVQDVAKVNRVPWRRDTPPTGDALGGGAQVAKVIPTAPPTSHLGQLVKNAFVVPAAQTNSNGDFNLEGSLQTKPRQFADDTFFERFLDGRDFSEQAYFSDGGDGKFPAPLGRSSRIPSAHRFRGVSIAKRTRIARSYVMQDLSADLDHITSLLLGQLQVFQQLEILDREPASISETHDHRALRRMGKQTKALPPNRRFFVGLKEVTRRVRQELVKVIVIAPDLESSIDDRMRDFLALAYQNEIPVIFALSRKLIGKAVGKNLDFSILGVVDVTGAQKLFDDAVDLAWQHRLAWLHRAESKRQNSTALSRK